MHFRGGVGSHTLAEGGKFWTVEIVLRLGKSFQDSKPKVKPEAGASKPEAGASKPEAKPEAKAKGKREASEQAGHEPGKKSKEAEADDKKAGDDKKAEDEKKVQEEIQLAKDWLAAEGL